MYTCTQGPLSQAHTPGSPPLWGTQLVLYYQRTGISADSVAPKGRRDLACLLNDPTSCPDDSAPDAPSLYQPNAKLRFCGDFPRVPKGGCKVMREAANCDCI